MVSPRIKYKLKWSIPFLLVAPLLALFTQWVAPAAPIPWELIAFLSTLGTIAMFVAAEKPEPFVPHERDVLGVYRDNIQWLRQQITDEGLGDEVFQAKLKKAQDALDQLLERGTVVRRGRGSDSTVVWAR